MVNKPKNIGTRGETATMRYAKVNGFPFAERLTLSGAHDRGDVALTPGPTVIIEVKSGKAAAQASDNQVKAWLQDTDRECIAAGADHSFLLRKRKGVGEARVKEWHAHMWVCDYLSLVGLDKDTQPRWYERVRSYDPDAFITLSYNSMLRAIRIGGYGEPL